MVPTLGWKTPLKLARHTIEAPWRFCWDRLSFIWSHFFTHHARIHSYRAPAWSTETNWTLHITCACQGNVPSCKYHSSHSFLSHKHTQGTGVIDKDKLDAAHYLLRPFLLRRVKDEVESRLPPKVETRINCPLSEFQTVSAALRLFECAFVSF